MTPLIRVVPSEVEGSSMSKTPRDFSTLATFARDDGMQTIHNPRKEWRGKREAHTATARLAGYAYAQ